MGSVFKIKDVPIFYLPYLKYPLTGTGPRAFSLPPGSVIRNEGLNLTSSSIGPWPGIWTPFPGLLRGQGRRLRPLEFRYLFEGGWGGLNAFYFGYRTPSTGVKPEDAVIFRWSHNQPLPELNIVANVDYQNSFSFTREFDNDFTQALVCNRSSQQVCS